MASAFLKRQATANVAATLTSPAAWETTSGVLPALAPYNSHTTQPPPYRASQVNETSPDDLRRTTR